MTFNEYLNTDIDNSNAIFDFYLEYLNEFSSKDFPYQEQIKLNGAAGKFLNCIDKVSYSPKDKRTEYLLIIEELTIALKLYRRNKDRSKLISVISPVHKVNLHKIQDLFERLFSMTLYFINEASRVNGYTDNLILNGFYQPANSNKKIIRDLIDEAKDLISEDNTITEKSKKQLIDYLNMALSDLGREHVNWSRFVGRIKETVIVLGALGSLAGGVTSLIQAKDKLEETATVIQQTSINFNHSILNETFNVHNIKQAGQLNSVVLMIQERNEMEE